MSQCFRLGFRAPLGALLVALTAACEDPLTDPALVAGPRIVGARVGVLGDPAVAEPAPGQGATIDWLVLSNEVGAYRGRVVWCLAAPTVLGAPRCGETFAEQSADGRWGEPLRLEFSVPEELEPGGAWLAWLGICGAGEPSFDAAASAFSCADGEALSGFYRGFAPEGAPNENPSLADDRLALDGAPWLGPSALPPPAAGEPCVGSPLPALRPGQPSSIAFELGGDDREVLEDPPGSYAAHPRESLVYTHLSSHPGLDRAFSAIDYDASELRFEVPFDAEPPSAAEGETLAFYLLVRDERGGVDWLLRHACLLPP